MTAGGRPATLSIRRVDGRFAVHRLPPDADLPADLPTGTLVSVTRTPEELSVVVPEGTVVPGSRVETGWACFRVVGPLAFTWTGIVASLTTALAEAGVPVFVLSTFDTDWILTPGERSDDAVRALRAAGHDVDGTGAG